MNFTRRDRWVIDEHRTQDTKESNYADVVSIEIARIALTYASLNDVDVTTDYIHNAYLQTPSYEKHYVICGK